MMRIDRERKIAFLEIDGTPSITEIQQAINELLEHPEHIDGMDEIWDFRKASMTSFNETELRKLSSFVKRRLTKLAKRTALLVSEDIDHGIGRMWMSYAEIEDANQKRQLFRKMEDAMKWLE